MSSRRQLSRPYAFRTLSRPYQAFKSSRVGRWLTHPPAQPQHCKYVPPMVPRQPISHRRPNEMRRQVAHVSFVIENHEPRDFRVCRQPRLNLNAARRRDVAVTTFLL